VKIEPQNSGCHMVCSGGSSGHPGGSNSGQSRLESPAPPRESGTAPVWPILAKSSLFDILPDIRPWWFDQPWHIIPWSYQLGKNGPASRNEGG
jgi:hypothetical protein